MLGLARFAMKSPLHSGILAAALAVVPLLYVFSAALVALTTLRHGLTTGTRILAFALMGGLVSWQITGIPMSLIVLVLVTLLASMLRVTQSWSRTLILSSVLGILVAFIMQQIFQAQFDAIIQSIQDVLFSGQTDSPEWQVLEASKSVLGFLILGSLVLETLLALLLGRYWQDGLFNPGGLRTEMHTLRFTRQEIAFLVVACAIAFFVQPIALLLFGIPFIFAGMALMHGVVAKLKLGGQWLVALYITLFFPVTNQILVPLLVLMVLIDPFVDIRSRIQERPQPDDE